MAAAAAFFPSTATLLVLAGTAQAATIMEDARLACSAEIEEMEKAFPANAEHRTLEGFSRIPRGDADNGRKAGVASIMVASASITDAVAWMLEDADDFSAVPDEAVVVGSRWVAAATGVLDCAERDTGVDVPEPMKCLSAMGHDVRDLLQAGAATDALAAALRETYDAGIANCERGLQ